jgi:hypothetical protein
MSSTSEFSQNHSIFGPESRFDEGDAAVVGQLIRIGPYANDEGRARRRNSVTPTPHRSGAAPTSLREDGKEAAVSAIQILPCRRQRDCPAYPFRRQRLVDPDSVALERDRGGCEVGEPDSRRRFSTSSHASSWRARSLSCQKRQVRG